MLSPKTLTITILIGSIIGATQLISWTHPNNDPNPLSADIKTAVAKSQSLLQVGSHKFIMASKHHCVSCHNNMLTAMVEAKMDQKGMTFVDSFRTERINASLVQLHLTCNSNFPDNLITSKFITPYALMGLYADKVQPDPNTDIAVDYILGQQQPDGSFQAQSGRPPHETGAAHAVAVSIHSIQLYASPAKKARVSREISLAKQWLTNYQPNTQQELAFQLLGLYWAGATTTEKENIAANLKAIQNADGSWSQLSSMRGDAYATSEALYALCESGMARPEEQYIQKGITWLLEHQDDTGAWIVASRTYPIQPFFNSHFPPYDENQFISAAATNWACLALLSTLPDDPKAHVATAPATQAAVNPNSR
jgi:squalene cyclase